MVIGNTNKHIAPYWGSEPNLKHGLNQLGIRNVAEQLFSTLLPGLNNVSVRIRYYSFYCWIIHQFYVGKDYIIDKEFNPFIRRAELLLALINATLDDSIGIPGINFASALLENGDNTFSLTKGADIENSSTYWANAGGIFRQYYVASLVELGLIGQNDKYPSIYNITKVEGYINGQMLADKFSKSVGEQAVTFLDAIKKGEISLDELHAMNAAFNMKNLSEITEERLCLQNMLLQHDNPLKTDGSIHRRKTILMILEYLHTNRVALKPLLFSQHIYSQYRESEDTTQWGWYAYYLDNSWQYQLTQIFHNILIILKNSEKLWTPVNEVSDSIAMDTISNFNVRPEISVEEFIAIMTDEPRHNPTAENFRILFRLYRDNCHHVKTSEQHYQDLNILSENFCDFMKMVNSSLQKRIFDFIKSLVEDIIYRHYRVSFRKMMQTNMATQKFAFENGCLRFLEGWEATNTAPRIDTIRNFLLDLNIIEEKEGIDRIVENGINLLKTYGTQSA